MKYVFNSYLQKIADTVKSPQDTIVWSDSLFDSKRAGHNVVKGFSDKNEPTGLNKLAYLLGIELSTPSFGNHPDFSNLINEMSTEYHYATSVFQDVKGSTSLLEKYSLPQVHTIINMISVVTTHTHGLFSGHIQRLQYDGVFSYFARKNLDKRQAVFNSLCATAFCSYFIKYELRAFFSNVHGFDKIHTKTGIDFGDDNQVMWAPFGVSGCFEISTNSLHTSLAFKIQEKSKNDQICVGKNVIQIVPSLKEYFYVHTDSNGQTNNIAWQGEKMAYEYFYFNWERFLVDHFSDFVKRGNDNNIYIDYDSDISNIPRIASLRNKALLTKIGVGKVDSSGKFNTEGRTQIPNSSDYGF